MDFSQDIQNLITDSKILPEILVNNSIEDFFSQEDLNLLKSFYRSCLGFNIEDSMKLLSIFRRFQFRQENDFAFLTVLIFELVTFKPYDYDNEYVLNLARKNTNEYQNKYPYPIITSKNGYLLTLKYLANSDPFFIDYAFECLANSLDRLDFDMANFIYNKEHKFFNRNEMQILFVERVTSIEAAEWIVNLNLFTREDYTVLYCIFKGRKMEFMAHLVKNRISDHTNKNLTVLTSEIFVQLIRSNNLSMLRFLNYNNVNDSTLAEEFEKSLNGNVKLFNLILKFSQKTPSNLFNIFMRTREYQWTGEIGKNIIDSKKLKIQEVLKAFSDAVEMCDFSTMEFLTKARLIPDFIIENAFSKYAKDGNFEMMNKVLETNQIQNHTVEKAFLNHVENNNIEMIDKMLTTNRIPDYTIQNVLTKYVESDNIEMMDKILESGKVQNYMVCNAFMHFVKNRNVEMVSRMLLTHQVEEYIVHDVFSHIVLNNDVEMIDRMLETGKVTGHMISSVFSSYTKTSNVRIMDNIIDKLLATGKVETYAIENAFYGYSRSYNVEMMDKLLATGKVTERIVREVFLNYSGNNNLEMIDKMLESGQVKDSMVEKAFSKYAEKNNAEMMIKMINTGKVGKLAIANVVLNYSENNNIEMIGKLVKSGKINFILETLRQIMEEKSTQNELMQPTMQLQETSA